MTKRKEGALSTELPDQLDDHCPGPVLESGGLMGGLKKALPERILNAEMDGHLAEQDQDKASNHR